MTTAQACSYYRQATASWSSGAVSSAGIHEIEESADQPLPRACLGTRMAVMVLAPTMLGDRWFGRVGEASALLTNPEKARGEMRYEAIDLNGLTPISGLEHEEPEEPLVSCYPKATHQVAARVTIRRGRLSFVAPAALEEAE